MCSCWSLVACCLWPLASCVLAACHGMSHPRSPSGDTPAPTRRRVGLATPSPIPGGPATNASDICRSLQRNHPTLWQALIGQTVAAPGVNDSPAVASALLLAHPSLHLALYPPATPLHAPIPPPNLAGPVPLAPLPGAPTLPPGSISARERTNALQRYRRHVAAGNVRAAESALACIPIHQRPATLARQAVVVGAPPDTITPQARNNALQRYRYHMARGNTAAAEAALACIPVHQRPRPPRAAPRETLRRAIGASRTPALHRPPTAPRNPAPSSTPALQPQPRPGPVATPSPVHNAPRGPRLQASQRALTFIDGAVQPQEPDGGWKMMLPRLPLNHRVPQVRIMTILRPP